MLEEKSEFEYTEIMTVQNEALVDQIPLLLLLWSPPQNITEL